MCITNTPTQLSGTNILAFPTRGGWQATIYGFSAKLEEKKQPKKKNQNKNKETKNVPTPAIVLPFPYPFESNDTSNQVRWINLKEYPTIFKDLHSLFPMQSQSTLAKKSKGITKSKFLKVETVGDYNCSVAYNLDDLDRFDPRVFTLAEGTQRLLATHYGTGYGFTIRTLTSNGTQHPIGFEHPQPSDDRLMFMTRHYHGDEPFIPYENEYKRALVHSDLEYLGFDHHLFSVNTEPLYRNGYTPYDEFYLNLYPAIPPGQRLQMGSTTIQDVVDRIVALNPFLKPEPVYSIRRLAVNWRNEHAYGNTDIEMGLDKEAEKKRAAKQPPSVQQLFRERQKHLAQKAKRAILTEKTKST